MPDLEEMSIFADVMSERLVAPYGWPYQQTMHSIVVVDGAHPLVAQLNEVERFKRSVLNAVRDALTAPRPKDRRDLPYALLALEAKDQHAHDWHRLTVRVERDVNEEGVWGVTHGTDQRETRAMVRTSVDDILDAVDVLMRIAVSKWVAEVEFKSEAVLDIPEKQPRGRG